MTEDPLALLPELCLVLGAVATLGTGMFVARQRQWAARAVAAAALLACLGTGAAALAGDAKLVYAYTWAVDDPLGAARLIVPLAGLLTICLSVDAVAGSPRETEFYVLVLLACLGTLVLAGASDLLVLAVGYLLASIPLYALAGGILRGGWAAEAALKLYLMGALLGVATLLGVTVLSGVARGTTYRDLAAGLPGAPPAAVAFGLVAVLAGLLFKAGAVPAHFWVPDVAEGAPTPAAAFVTTVPKVGGLIAAYRLLTAVPTDVVDWPLLLALVAAASMTLGNLAAFAQRAPRRLLGYSTISQVGYALLAVAVAGRTDLALPALLFYLGAYAATNLGAFAVVAELPEAATLADYRGLSRRDPVLAGALLVCLLGLLGTPPTAIFVGKVVVFSAAWSGGYGWLAVLAAVNTVASLFYYLRWLAPTYGTGPVDRPAALQPAGTYARGAAVSAAVSTVALGLAAGPALDLVTGPLLR